MTTLTMFRLTAYGLTLGLAGAAFAGAPAPDQRRTDFAHVCKGGTHDGDACTVATEDADCPNGTCVTAATANPIKGTLTVIAHDTVTDWVDGQAPNRAITVLLEVKDPDGEKQLLAATYQNVVDPTERPLAPGEVVAIGMDEEAVAFLASDVPGIVFAQAESTLASRLQSIFGTTGVPALVAAEQKKSQLADHQGDDLATVLRFNVKFQFLTAN